MVRRRVAPSAAARPEGFHIRIGTPEDSAFVRQLSTEVFTQFGDYSDLLPSYLEHRSVFTAIGESEGLAVGFIMLALVTSKRPLPWELEQLANPRGEWLDVEILAIAVRPEQQGRHIGQQLMQYAFRCAGEWQRISGVRTLQLNVASTNSRARRFFRKMGFRVVAPADGVYPRGQRSIRMARPVGEPTA